MNKCDVTLGEGLHAVISNTGKYLVKLYYISRIDNSDNLTRALARYLIPERKS